MPDPAQLRDSTQIVVPWAAVADVVGELEERFVVTVTEAGSEEGYCRIVGSPVEIKETSRFLARNGVAIA